MKNKENILGTEKISKLMIKFSIPAVISMLVNSLYNVVDQIFIGRVDYLGNGATSIIFPLVMMCSALAGMLGDGAAAFLSLKLGEKKKEEATKGVITSVISSVFLSIIVFTGLFFFLGSIVDFLGCTPNIKPLAIAYGRYITIGFPFMIISTVMNAIIRADGSPKYSMISMVTGAVLNCILDPIFIFVLKQGVAGAAMATAISQFVSFLINVNYLRKFKSIDFKLKGFKYDFAYLRKVCMLGISSIITQMSIVIIVIVENNVLNKIGAASRFGADIPITVLGIVMKISQILNSVILGICIGSQPIIGFNYGAGKYDRVKKAIKYVLVTSTIISTLAFILFQTIPEVLIGAFGSGDALYMEFACMTFRIYLMLTILNGIQMPTGIIFQAIGKSKKSAILSLSRQIVFLIPSMIILGNIFGIDGVLYSGPFADALAFILSVTLLTLELKSMKGTDEIGEDVIKDKEKVKGNLVITIAREYGSGGRFVGELVAKDLGIKCYDKELIDEISYESGLSKKYVQEHEQKSVDNHLNGNLSTTDELFIQQTKTIKQLADTESCVIVGRCGNAILKDYDNTLHVFIYSDDNHKVERAVKYYGLKKRTALKEINKINKERAKHYKAYTDLVWNDSSNYDLSINSDLLGVEETAKVIVEMAKKKGK